MPPVETKKKERVYRKGEAIPLEPVKAPKVDEEKKDRGGDKKRTPRMG